MVGVYYISPAKICGTLRNQLLLSKKLEKVYLWRRDQNQNTLFNYFKCIIQDIFDVNSDRNVYKFKV